MSAKQKMLEHNSKAVETPLSILERCVGFPQQPWRGSSTPETDWTYASKIITDITDWKI